jgi:creatinine amidohydrolase
MSDLSHLTTVEVGAALADVKLAILPVGATEQHGPHLELCTDAAIASEMARRLDEELGELSLLCPALPYGLSEHHLTFSGTLTLRPATFISLIVEIAESLAQHGIRRLVVVNGHGGNVDAVRLAARIALRDHDVRVAHVMWATLASDVIAEEMVGRGRHNHACEVETSLALALQPSLVRRGRLAPSVAVLPPNDLTDPPAARVDVPRRFEEWTENGCLGDATRATVEFGERISRTALDRALEFARAFALEPV